PCRYLRRALVSSLQCCLGYWTTFLISSVIKYSLFHLPGSPGIYLTTSHTGPAMEALWQQCCSDSALVRSTCCDAVVLLVDQGHADLQFIHNSVLNLLPSASLLLTMRTAVGMKVRKLMEALTSETLCPEVSTDVHLNQTSVKSNCPLRKQH
uniref:Uncharacterized protein n=1 Tax=Xiphophorus couchianus TaxID=32473 RepID=A0A3B5L9M7_9TELE